MTSVTAERARIRKVASHLKQVRRANKKHSATLLVNQSVAKALFKKAREANGCDTMRISRNGRTAVRHMVTTIMSRVMQAVSLNNAQFKTARINAARVNVSAQLIGLPGNEALVRATPVDQVIAQCQARTARRNKNAGTEAAASAGDHIMAL